MFERVNAAIDGRRTREPSTRPADRVDPFLLRGLLACGHCGKPMTTSSSRKLAKRGPRYYRCRQRGCVGGQLPALAIETRVVNSLSTPPANLDRQARAACEEVAHMWPLLMPVNRSRVLAYLFKEIRWAAMRGELAYVVDPEAAADLTRDLAAG